VLQYVFLFYLLFWQVLQGIEPMTSTTTLIYGRYAILSKDYWL